MTKKGCSPFPDGAAKVSRDDVFNIISADTTSSQGKPVSATGAMSKPAEKMKPRKER